MAERFERRSLFESLFVVEKRFPQLLIREFCGEVPASIANTDAVAADWPRIINTGSIRMDPYAMWERIRCLLPFRSGRQSPGVNVRGNHDD